MLKKKIQDTHFLADVNTLDDKCFSDMILLTSKSDVFFHAGF